MNATSIDICICTFRRAHIIDTIKSLVNLDINPDWTIRIIVVDNDNTPSAEEMVRNIAPQIQFPIIYIHAPAGNISIARNACLDAATADYIAFIDDDEIVSSQWLRRLWETAKDQSASAVLGPVDAVYADDAPAWMKRGRFHDTRPVWVNGEIITGYTCNLLLRRTVIKQNKLRFSESLGKSGGEDTEFLSSLYRAGEKIAYTPDAMITEPVPQGRASASWLIKRRFRSGQTHALLLIQKKKCKFKSSAIALTKAAFCFGVGVLFFWDKTKMYQWVLRGTLHIGVVAKLLGKKDLVQYG